MCANVALLVHFEFVSLQQSPCFARAIGAQFVGHSLIRTFANLLTNQGHFRRILIFFKIDKFVFARGVGARVTRCVFEQDLVQRQRLVSLCVWRYLECGKLLPQPRQKNVGGSSYRNFCTFWIRFTSSTAIFRSHPWCFITEVLCD